jgi:hypothetical protein
MATTAASAATAVAAEQQYLPGSTPQHFPTCRMQEENYVMEGRMLHRSDMS